MKYRNFTVLLGTCKRTDMILKNIKATMFLSEPLFEKEMNSKKMKSNIQNISIIVYHHSPAQLNVTGVENFQVLQNCKRMIENKFKCKIIKTRIDCCFFSHKETRKNQFNIDLGEAYYFLRDSKVFFVSFEPESPNLQKYCQISRKSCRICESIAESAENLTESAKVLPNQQKILPNLQKVLEREGES